MEFELLESAEKEQDKYNEHIIKTLQILTFSYKEGYLSVKLEWSKIIISKGKTTTFTGGHISMRHKKLAIKRWETERRKDQQWWWWFGGLRLESEQV